MIKVTVLYPQTAGARFDHAYYRDRHMPMVKSRMGDACVYYTVEKGLAGGAPGAAAPYVTLGQIVCTSLDDFQSVMQRHGPEIMGDIPNYTDIQPVIQVSDVVVERG